MLTNDCVHIFILTLVNRWCSNPHNPPSHLSLWIVILMSRMELYPHKITTSSILDF